MKKTKIICTMGPNTNDRNLIKDLALAGMDIARFNFSHGDHEEQAGRFALIKSVREELNIPIATLLDTKGPEIRTGAVKDDKKVTLVEGQKYTLTTRQVPADDKINMVTYAGLPEDVTTGNIILIDDGLIELKVDKVEGTEIECTVINGGDLGSKKGVNVPNVSIRLPGITEKDKEDIIGSQTRVKIVKNKVAPPFKIIDFDIMYGEGISKTGELLDLGIKANVVEKSGSWFAYNGEKLGQGRENAKIFLRDHPDVALEIENKIKADAGHLTSELIGDDNIVSDEE